MTLQELQAYIASGGRGAANSYGDMAYGDWTLGAPMIQRPGDVMSESEAGPQLATGYALQDRQGLFGGMAPQIDPRTGMVTIGGQTMSADDFSKRYLTATNVKGEGFGPTDATMGAFDTQTGQMVGQDQWHTAGMSALDKLLAAGMPAAVLAGFASGVPGLFGGGAAGAGETAALGMDQVGALSGLGEAGAAGEAAAGLGGGLGAGGASLVPEAMAGWGAGLPEMLTTTGMGSQVAGGLGSWGAAGSALGAGLGGATLGGFVQPSMLDSLKNLIPSGVSEVASSLGGLKTILPVVGGLLGASEAGKPSTATSQSKTDPRLDQYLYGSGYGDKNSLLGAAQDLWQQNKSGMNPTMQQGLDMQKAALTDPAYAQSYTAMRNAGSGLLGQGVAGNPFTNGQQGQVPTMQAGGQGGLLGAPDIRSLIARGRGLIG